MELLQWWYPNVVENVMSCLSCKLYEILHMLWLKCDWTWLYTLHAVLSSP